MRTRPRPTDQPTGGSLPLEVEWPRLRPEPAGNASDIGVEIQEGRVRTSGIDIPAFLAIAALLLGLYSVTRSVDSVDAQQVMPTTETQDVLCPEGRALRGITRHGTAICTDAIAAANAPTAITPTTVAREMQRPTDWCYRVEVLGSSDSDPGCLGGGGR